MENNQSTTIPANASSKEKRRVVSSLRDKVEALSSILHDIFVAEAKRQSDLRHPEKYEDLPDNIKEYNRVAARHIFSLMTVKMSEAYQEGLKDQKIFERKRKSVITKVLRFFYPKIKAFLKKRKTKPGKKRYSVEDI